MRVVSLILLAFVLFVYENLIYPSEDAALGEQAPEHALPANAIILYDGLIGNTEGTASRKAPVCRIQSNRRLLKRFTCAAERKEAIRGQVRENEDEYVQRQVCNRRCLFRHFRFNWSSFEMSCRFCEIRVACLGCVFRYRCIGGAAHDVEAFCGACPYLRFCARRMRLR
jgi:hypothetical protein